MTVAVSQHYPREPGLTLGTSPQWKTPRLAQANGLIIIAEVFEPVAAGEPVAVIPLTRERS